MARRLRSLPPPAPDPEPDPTSVDASPAADADASTPATPDSTASTSTQTVRLVPSPDDASLEPSERFGPSQDPRVRTVEVLRERLERRLQPVDDPSPVAWLADGEHDRLIHAISVARHGEPGRSNADDEAEAREILQALRAFELAGDSPVWTNVNVITRADLSEALKAPLPPAATTTAAVQTPAYVYVSAVCPRCWIAGEILVTLRTQLVVKPSHDAELQLKAKATALPHVCGQKRLDDEGGPLRPFPQMTLAEASKAAADDATEDDDGSADSDAIARLEAATGATSGEDLELEPPEDEGGAD